MFWLLRFIFVLLFLFSLLFVYLGVIFVDAGAVIFDWVFFRVVGIDMGVMFLFDRMRMIFAGVVFMISGCVFFYMLGYMSGEKEILRFGLLVLLFVLSIFFVIISPSFITILLG